MIIFFAIERNEEMTSKKCCESKYYYNFYKFLLELNWNYELLYNNLSVVVITEKKGNIYACKSLILNVYLK